MFHKKIELNFKESYYCVIYSAIPQSEREIIYLIDSVDPKPDIIKWENYSIFHYYPLNEQSEKVSKAFCKHETFSALIITIIEGILKNEMKII